MWHWYSHSGNKLPGYKPCGWDPGPPHVFRDRHRIRRNMRRRNMGRVRMFHLDSLRYVVVLVVVMIVAHPVVLLFVTGHAAGCLSAFARQTLHIGVVTVLDDGCVAAF